MTHEYLKDTKIGRKFCQTSKMKICDDEKLRDIHFIESSE